MFHMKSNRESSGEKNEKRQNPLEMEQAPYQKILFEKKYRECLSEVNKGESL
ncbi:hypothetical protein Syun_016881 [Stephania yunnanensis]|uniref:Uncharacterized protein n=1 Tax=Stephania yunnanensis TaxID=152371 RepID=A0AAP0J5X2_9MAGN